MPADGFYEWSAVGKKPHLFTFGGGAPFVIAGFWEEHAEGNRCCLLTTSCNSVLEPIHHRMPVIIQREDWPLWFGQFDDENFLWMTSPCRAEGMQAVEVSAVVNSARIDDERCGEPAPPVQIKADLNDILPLGIL